MQENNQRRHKIPIGINEYLTQEYADLVSICYASGEVTGPLLL
jgi:hypothetical protein